MPVRSKRPQTKQPSSITSRDIARLRTAIREGFPWKHHLNDNLYRQAILHDSRLEILLSYVTGIGTLSVWGDRTTEHHPSKETVRAVKKLLKDDIDAAEKEFKDTFVGERYSDDDFRYIRPG